MEKVSELKTALPPQTQAPRGRRRKLLHFLFAGLSLFFAFHFLRTHFNEESNVCYSEPDCDPDAPAPQDTFNWTNVKPSKELIYHDCFGGLNCALLTLPLDYWNGTNPDETISLAVLRVPAQVPVTDPRYNGPIFINPGGPGGSGTTFAQFGGQALQKFVDSNNPVFEASPNSTEKYHDIIGFDPRGVGYTRPPASCFDDDEYRFLWLFRTIEEGIPGSSNAALGRLLSKNRALTESCNEKANEKDNILNYISTAHVARDILELAERQDIWLEVEKARLLGKSPSEIAYAHYQKTRPPTATNEKSAKKVKVNFWGFSYGTFLGATFAAMFPDNVGHVILDGVLEPHDFQESHWIGSLTDTEKGLNTFYESCAAAGPEQCALAKNGSTAGEIRERFQSILTQLYHNPFPFQAPYGPEVIPYSVIKALIFNSLYSPVAIFPLMAQLFQALENKDISSVTNFMAEHSAALKLSAYPKIALPMEAGTGVQCTDADPRDDDIDYYQQQLRELDGVSPAGGGVLMQVDLRCAGWKTRNVRYNGPWDGKVTSTPMLWIGNTADPICPLKSAENMARRFPGSVVLQHDTTGHCSLAAYSHCTTAAIRAYFHNGTLPEPDTICPVVQFPFNTPSPGQKLDVTSENVRLEYSITAAAHEYVRDVFWELGMGFGMTPRMARSVRL